MVALLELKDGAIQVGYRYNLEFYSGAPGEILMNGLCEETHGMGDVGSISLMSIRAQDIANRAFADVQALETMPTSIQPYSGSA